MKNSRTWQTEVKISVDLTADLKQKFIPHFFHCFAIISAFLATVLMRSRFSRISRFDDVVKNVRFFSSLFFCFSFNFHVSSRCLQGLSVSWPEPTSSNERRRSWTLRRSREKRRIACRRSVQIAMRPRRRPTAFNPTVTALVLAILATNLTDAPRSRQVPSGKTVVPPSTGRMWVRLTSCLSFPENHSANCFFPI